MRYRPVELHGIGDAAVVRQRTKEVMSRISQLVMRRNCDIRAKFTDFSSEIIRSLIRGAQFADGFARRRGRFRAVATGPGISHRNRKKLPSCVARPGPPLSGTDLAAGEHFHAPAGVRYGGRMPAWPSPDPQAAPDSTGQVGSRSGCSCHRFPMQRPHETPLDATKRGCQAKIAGAPRVCFRRASFVIPTKRAAQVM